MQQVELPPWLKVPGVMWVVILVGFGIWSEYNVDDPQLAQMIVGGVIIVLRVLVNNDKALETAVNAGTSLLDYVFRQRNRTLVAPTVAETGMRGGRVEVDAIEAIPVQKMPPKPNKMLSVLFG